MKNLWHLLKRNKILLVFSLLMALCTVVATLYVPIAIGDAIDLIISAGKVDLTGILQILIRVVIVVLLTGMFQWLMNVCNNKIAFQVTRDLRNQAIEKIERLPLSYLDTHPYGDIVSRMTSDVDQVSDGLVMGFTQAFTGIITILGTLGYMFSIHKQIALLVVVLTPISLFVARFIAKHTYDMFTLQSKTRGEQTALVEEMLGAKKVVAAFGYEDRACERYNRLNEELHTYSLKAIFYSSLVNPSTRFVNSLVYATVALSGGFTVLSGGLTVGALTCLLSYANQYTKPFNEISGVVTELQNAIACLERVLDLIHQEPEVEEDEDAIVFERVAGNVVLTDVDFSYTADKKLIENLNLTVKPGQKIAIVGPTGCGKTTVINLLMRFYDVCAGSIAVEGHDIRHATRHSLRSSYGMVLQDTWIKAGTVRDNITMGQSGYSEERIIQAAKDAHAYSFIKRLPDGLDTVLTEDDQGMSQGEKQLLCIARIMLNLPKMLILDEATSSIDTRTELKIQSAFLKMMEGRTSFIVAHRLSTIQSADVILVMKDGHIIEQGTHEQLLALGGFYKELYMSQFQMV